MKTIILRFLSALLLVSLLLAGQSAQPAYAMSYVVNTAADNTNNDDNFCTLREAIMAANNDAAYNGDCGTASISDDTITFDIPGDATITLSPALGNLPNIVSGAGALIIDGGRSITISGNNIVRVMYVNSGANLTLRDLTIDKGTYSSGGGVFNYGNLTIINSTFSGNRATFGDGGGIANYGTLTITGSTFSNNSADNGFGGGVFNNGTLTIINSTFSGNSVTGNLAGGGGVANNGTLTIINSTFSDNAAPSNKGGGVYNSGTLNYTNTIIANSASGGDCVNIGTISTNTRNLVEDGSCSASLSGDPSLGALTDSPAYFPLNPGSVAIDAGTNSGCSATDQRGVPRPQDGDGDGAATCDIGSYELTAPVHYMVNTTNDDTIPDIYCTLREAILAANNTPANANCGPASSDNDTITFTVSGTITLTLGTLPNIVSGRGTLTIDGGGNITISGNNLYRVMWVDSGADLTLQNLTVANGNAFSSSGGGVYNNGTLNITGSTFSANNAFSLSGGGGGVYNSGTLTITNSTFSGNNALGAGVSGGGVYNAGTLSITNATFSNNSASYLGGGIYINSGTATLKNTIIANSAGGDCVGVLSSLSINNLIEGPGTCNLTNGSYGNIIGQDPNLGALIGSPAYFPLNMGSPAIDAGDNATCEAPPVNNQSQNGVARPQDGNGIGGADCDIGAYEAPTPFLIFLPLTVK